MKGNQNRLLKNCESFVYKLYKSNRQTFNIFASKIMEYKSTNTRPLNLLNEIVNLISNNNALLAEFNKTLHPDLKIPIAENPPNQENLLQEKLESCFNVIKNKDPEKMSKNFWKG